MSNIDNNSEILHYKRGMFFVNKLFNLFPDGIYNKQFEEDFVKKEINRFFNYSIARFDLHNFMFLCTVSLMGLNKENMEKCKNIKDYKYKIDYDVVNEKNVPIELLNYLNSFSANRVIKTEYDDWLSVNHVNSLSNFDFNYLFNVRNAFMHSEYSFDLFRDYPIISNVYNSNYTGFSAKIFNPKYYEFVKHYFSNDSFFGLVEKRYSCYFLEYGDNIINDEALLDFISNKTKVGKYDYDNKLKVSKIFEKTILSRNREITDYELKKHNIKYYDVVLSSEDIEQVYFSIKSYYGDKFYELSNNDKLNVIFTAVKYRLDFKSVISSWTLHFYRLASGITRVEYYNDEFYSLFAMVPTLLILKSYLILYRLQNKKLENYEIDYNLFNEFEFDYEINYYNDYKLKLNNKGIFLKEDEYKIKYFLEIFRDALAHGNIDMFYKKQDDNILQYFKFTDKWKNNERNIIIELKEVEKFLSSECFNSKYLNDNAITKSLVKSKK